MDNSATDYNDYDPIKSLIETAAYLVGEEGEDIAPAAEWLQGALHQYVSPEESQLITNEFFFKRSNRSKTPSPHPNWLTGEPCDCGFNYTKWNNRPLTSSVKTGDKLHDYQ